MLQVEYRKEGMQNYMVLPCEKNRTQGYESRLMQYHVVPHMIPYEIREVNEICEIYYRLQYRTTLHTVLGHLPLNMFRLFHMLDSIVGVLEMAEEYLFDADCILWNAEYVFIEADTGRLQFCSYPDKGIFCDSLRDLLTKLIQQVDKKDDTAVMYLLQFYNLVTEPDCSLTALRKYVMKYSCEMVEEPEKLSYEKGNVRRFQDDLSNSPEETMQSQERNQNKKKDEKIPDKAKNEQNNPRKKMNRDENGERMGEKIIKWLLILTTFFNLGLIALLLFDVLTYDYVRYLLGSMGTLIVLTIIYMNISKEETPDEMMQAFFEENSIPACDRVQSRLAYAGVTQEYPVPGQLETDNDVKGKECNRENQRAYHKVLQQYGETTVLMGEDEQEEDRKVIVEEEHEAPLFLASFAEGKYKPIYVENSIIVGCMEEGCSYLLKQRGISRMHAKLMKKADGLFLLDLNSTNGTYLNGEALVSGEEFKLEEGDVVAFAQCEFYVAKDVQGLSA